MRAATRGLDIRVRDAEDGDVAAICALYAHYVRTGAANFEESPPEADGAILGFAYAGPFRHRA